MITFSLQSGSNGNATYVEAGGVRLLFDAGIPARKIRDRLLMYGKRVHDLHALILSHDHHDHCCCAGTTHRLFKMPVYATPATARACRFKLGKIARLGHFEAGQTLRFGEVQVHTIPTPHDAVDGVAFVVEHERKRLGIFVDVGSPFRQLREAVESVDAAYLESNYDVHMLENGPYEAQLKARIRGGRGHLSNDEAAELLHERRARRPQWIALSHLSAENNRPELAMRASRDRLGEDFPLLIAGRNGVSPLLHV